MSAPQVAMQIAVVARWLATPAVVDIVAHTDDGPAVFAVGQPFENAYPRLIIETPQWLPRLGACGRSGDLAVTFHSWTRGPDCTLTAAELADAGAEALGPALALSGWRVSSWDHEGSTSVGDPSPGIAHVVTRLRYSVQRTG